MKGIVIVSSHCFHFIDLLVFIDFDYITSGLLLYQERSCIAVILGRLEDNRTITYVSLGAFIQRKFQFLFVYVFRCTRLCIKCGRLLCQTYPVASVWYNDIIQIQVGRYRNCQCFSFCIYYFYISFLL